MIPGFRVIFSFYRIVDAITSPPANGLAAGLIG